MKSPVPHTGIRAAHRLRSGSVPSLGSTTDTPVRPERLMATYGDAFVDCKYGE
jgi:hypothetical protein